MPPATALGKADAALRLGEQNERDIAAHEDLCAERYKNIGENIASVKSEFRSALADIKATSKGQTDEIKGVLKWAGGTLCSIIIALLGFLLAQQLTANDVARTAAAQKIEILERQVAQPPRVVTIPQPQP